MANAVGIIPARWASSRFPGKPLALIAGQSMIRRVWEQAKQARCLRDVIVATDDPRIEDACRSFGASVAMTSPHHATGSDRLAEVAEGLRDEVVVNIQGDEPTLAPAAVDRVVEALLEDPTCEAATLAHPADEAAAHDPNRVKVVLDERGYALYFSRSPIPYSAESIPRWQHVGLYAYRREFLLKFVSLPRTPAEVAEELEQLRVLEHGFRMRVARLEGWRSIPVDVPEDVVRVERWLAAQEESER